LHEAIAQASRLTVEENPALEPRFFEAHTQNQN
jgi:hypothetical protein